MVAKLRSSKCVAFTTDETAYNCVTYMLSQDCFGQIFSSKGLEIGEEDNKSHNLF